MADINDVSTFFSDDNSVYTKLLMDISQGIFKSGDRLVTTKLSERYGTSVNPVREAIKQLQGQGFVNVLKNSGARVKKFEYKHMRDVFEIIQLLEPYLISYFINQHTEEDLQALKNIHQNICQLTPDEYQNYATLDAEFHWTMYRNHYNKSAVETWRSHKIISQALHANMKINRVRLVSSTREHGRLIECLEQGNAQGAKAALIEHINNSGDYWLSAVEQ
ncbi:GntR family transcriptional regulator [Gayadomonas joobiniege]|uniref:GntR family transcriptional regulator n=1 Tax=Gayadomonas joobiniege TaxID=1234606 RepID=UPI000377C3D7|nr:GntR family transcriptional regulator [Gayadomonas joobiniege]